MSELFDIEPLVTDGKPLSARRYLVELWDDDDWSLELAEKFLGPCSFLTWRETGKALRELRSRGWSEMTVHVGRVQ